MDKPEVSVNKAEAVVQKMMEHDAFSKFLGLEIEEVGVGYCRLHFKVREEMLNGFGILHGGVTFAAADSAFAFACNSHGRLSVALSSNMDYLEAGQLGDVLTIEAKEEGLKNKVSVYQLRITNQHGTLIALFKGTAYRTSKEHF